MQTDNIRTIIVGLGEMGRKLVQILSKKEGVTIAAAVDVKPELIGRDLGEVCGTGKTLGVMVEGDIAAACGRVEADVALYLTVTGVDALLPQVKPAIAAGMNVISTSEPLAYPWQSEPELSTELDQMAKAQGVSVLGTGVCPGLIPDVIPIVASAGCYEIEHIDLDIFGDVVPYGPTVWAGMGLGLDPAEYEKKLGKEVDIEFSEPALMIAAAIGWDVDRIEADNKPLIAPWDIQVGDLFVKKGMVSGFDQTTRCYQGDKEVIRSRVYGPVCCDLPPFKIEVSITGKPSVKLKYELIHEDGWTTSTMLVNMIPKIINAKPGLVSMKDLRLPSAVLGDMRKLID